MSRVIIDGAGFGRQLRLKVLLKERVLDELHIAASGRRAHDLADLRPCSDLANAASAGADRCVVVLDESA